MRVTVPLFKEDLNIGTDERTNVVAIWELKTPHSLLEQVQSRIRLFGRDVGWDQGQSWSGGRGWRNIDRSRICMVEETYGPMESYGQIEFYLPRGETHSRTGTEPATGS